VGGVTPGKGGTRHPDPKLADVPIFDTVMDARKKTGATATSIYVPPRFAADAILEAIDAEVPLIVCITEGIPVLDMVKVKRALDGSKSRLIGPNCPGVLTPNACKIGIMPGNIFKAGKVGIVSRSGTLTYEAVKQTNGRRSRPVDGGRYRGDPVKGTEFHRGAGDVLADPDTNSIIMIGEIGGAAEEDAADFIKSEAKQGRKKPMARLHCWHDRPARPPHGPRRGHHRGGKGKAEDKVEAMKSAGISVADSPAALAPRLPRR